MTAAFFSHPVNLVLIRLDVPPAMRLTIPCASMKIPTPDAKIASIYRTKLIHADAFVCVMCFFIFDFCTPSREDCALVSSRPCSSSLPPTRLMFACARNKKKSQTTIVNYKINFSNNAPLRRVPDAPETDKKNTIRS